ncbi:hypothetical protein Tco_0647841 [Tanacetum coccineum]
MFTIPTTLEVSSSNPTSPTLTGEKHSFTKKPKESFCPQEFERNQGNMLRKFQVDVQINTIVMPIRITFDNPIDFNDHLSKPKDLKKDLTISFDSTTTSNFTTSYLEIPIAFHCGVVGSVILNSLESRTEYSTKVTSL